MHKIRRESKFTEFEYYSKWFMLQPLCSEMVKQTLARILVCGLLVPSVGWGQQEFSSITDVAVKLVTLLVDIRKTPVSNLHSVVSYSELVSTWFSSVCPYTDIQNITIKQRVLVCYTVSTG